MKNFGRMIHRVIVINFSQFKDICNLHNDKKVQKCAKIKSKSDKKLFFLPCLKDNFASCRSIFPHQCLQNSWIKIETSGKFYIVTKSFHFIDVSKGPFK